MNNKKRTENMSDFESKQAKRIKISFSNELIVEIFRYLVFNLLHIEYKHGDVNIKKKSNPLLPLIVMRNVMLTSKEFKNLFEICFKEIFGEKFKVDLKKGASSHLLKNVVRSSVIHLSSLRTENRILTMDGDDSMNCELNVYGINMFDMFKWLGCFNVFYDMYYIINIPLEEFFCGVVFVKLSVKVM